MSTVESPLPAAVAPSAVPASTAPVFSSYLTSLCLGAVGGALVMIAGRLLTPVSPMPATVDIQKLLTTHITEASAKKLDGAEALRDAKRYGQALEASLDALARERHALLVPKAAVLRGAPDLTEELATDIAARMAAPASGTNSP